MNILVFSWRDPKHPLAGGAEQVMHEHMKGWRQAGHSVCLFSSKIKGRRSEETLGGIKIIRRGCQYAGVQLAAPLYYLKYKKKYDFVVDQFHGIPFFTPLYVAKPKLAVVQETARKVWFLNPFPKPFNWAVGFLGYMLEPFVFSLYKKTRFMTGSKSAKEDLIKYGIPDTNISIIPHGVLLPRRKIIKHKPQLRTIVYLGMISKDKGIEDAIKCFSILNRTGKYNFWVIGKPENDKYLKRIKYMAEAYKLGKDIRFWGFVDQKKKFELLARAHVLVNPSVHEGWGLVNIEANAMGIPVIGYNSSGLVDSVKNNVSGIIVNKNTPEELAKEILFLLNNRRKHQEMEKMTVSWSHNFSWQKSRKLSLDLIESGCI